MLQLWRLGALRIKLPNTQKASLTLPSISIWPSGPHPSTIMPSLRGSPNWGPRTSPGSSSPIRAPIREIHPSCPVCWRTLWEQIRGNLCLRSTGHREQPMDQIRPQIPEGDRPSIAPKPRPPSVRRCGAESRTPLRFHQAIRCAGVQHG
jgi:hypothetical protein